MQKPKRKYFSVVTTEEVNNCLHNLAKSKGVSVSSLVRNMLYNKLKKLGLMDNKGNII